ncbi:PAP2 superfamily protein [Pirellula sp. SH-Sr6A]|uniref:phosphatase PAP2 family protein n=1 Tax=Pirellula sp. SH-Sr6A TaxID=1632865 RepID=UPI00078DE23C|nr:phosphatase PAP2 family protein [Pirellula sp. SH-Sr6A]AMV33730.1 PAP2 superfamily protein [Pirellula sp. SH-Sr6A]
MKHRLRTIEQLESRDLLASDWQNTGLLCDVDQSSLVTPQDVLMLINSINSEGSRELSPRSQHSTTPLYDVDGDRWVTPLDPLMVINSINRYQGIQATVVGGVAPASDPNNNGVVLSPSITIQGQTLANSVVTVSVLGDDSVSQSMTSDGEGRFSAALSLSRGLQTVRLSARDELGRQSTQTLEVRRGNTIQDWNASVLNIVRQWTTTSNDPYPGRIVTAQPPMVARNLAMIHSAMFDAANAVTGQYEGYRVDLSEQTDASESAAAAAAAFEVAKSLYSAVDEIAVWQASLQETLVQIPDGPAKTLGVALGQRVGQAILADRVNDGMKSSSIYEPSSAVGAWRRTFPDYLPPLLPQWPNVKPFALERGDSLRPEPPPSITSVEYQTAVDEVMRMGGFHSSERTTEQTEIALFWADGGGTATPPGHWNSIATDVTIEQSTDLIETARTFALLNIAMADAGIASWDAKYYYGVWRPIDAIRQADQDGSTDTQRDPTWIPLLKTPPFPSYTSGHSTFSGAASAVLTHLFGNHVSFYSQSDGHGAAEQRPLDPRQIVTRHFTSFSEAAEEAAQSRIFGGIHFQFDDLAGRNLGEQIGAFVTERLLLEKN